MTKVTLNPLANAPFDDILKCVHCGLCLEACPTYGALRTEQDSPRGRLYLMRGLWEGELQPEPSLLAPLDRCLDCRACESVCPSSVPYGALLDKTRAALQSRRKRGRLRSLLLKRVLASTRLLAWTGKAARLFVRLVPERRLLAKARRGEKLGKLVRARLLTPRFSGRSFKRAAGAEPLPPLDGGAPRRRVASFAGCVMDVAEAAIHEATIRLLRAAGCEVVVPPTQTCCGALPAHAGERAFSLDLARRNAAAFEAADVDAIAVNAAGCGAQLKTYARVFAESGEPAMAARWAALAAKTRDVLDLLAELDAGARLKWRADPVTALYDAPCHLIHAQRIDAGPRTFLAGLPGVALRPLREADRCCGAAGVYNLEHPALADRILDRKLDDIAACAADGAPIVLLTANPGCLFQLRYGVARRGLPLEVLHPLEWLARRLAP